MTPQQVEAMTEAEQAERVAVLDGNFPELAGFTPDERARLVVIVDTYAQTAADDEKGAVSAFNKNIRRLIEATGADVVVLDHLQKSGGEFMGSLAKLGDADGMVKLTRKGDRHALLTCEKLKDAPEFEPIALELLPVELEGVADHAGRPYGTLIATEGSQTYRQAKAVTKGAKTTAAGVLLNLIHEPVTKATLRELFTNHESQTGELKSRQKAFNRALEILVNSGLVTLNGELVDKATA
ncbi:hypothetical protein [Rhodoferax sp.]|uniref:hypothetical protein n=1 Tax=Rhodoferax sp. TaxID=50421 RepID=UPI0025FDB10C|nr:hypothetical protein [Rhodoferax sp.]